MDELGSRHHQTVVGKAGRLCFLSSVCLIRVPLKPHSLRSVSSENELEHGKLFRRVKVILTQWENM